MVMTQGLGPILGGVAAGTIAAVSIGSVVASLLFEVQPRDPATFAGVVSLLTIAGLLACYIPARRAAKVDPLSAMRAE